MQLSKLRELLTENRQDRIYDYTLDILKTTNKKTIINVGHICTREILVQKLKADLKKRVVEYDGTTSEKRRIRELFAPVAHGKKTPKRKQIDILVASGSASEGHDLQDAEIIINYDLWWTPLMLQQRMGRLDRPTDKPREFSALNLVNINSEFTSMVHMDEKLRERAKELKGIIADGAYEPVEDRDWSNLQNTDFGVLSIEEVPEESDLEIVTTSQHIVDLADAKQSDIDFANSLPPGFMSACEGDIPGTYVMIKDRKDIFTGFLHEDGTASYAPGDQTYEKLIGYIRASKNDQAENIPEDHLKNVEILTSAICEKNRLDSTEIVTVFSVSVIDRNSLR